MKNVDKLTYKEILVLNDVVNQNIQRYENELAILKINPNIDEIEKNLNQLFKLSEILNNKNGQLFTLNNDFYYLNVLINTVSNEIILIIDNMNENDIQVLGDVEYLTKLIELKNKIDKRINELSDFMNSII